MSGKHGRTFSEACSELGVEAVGILGGVVIELVAVSLALGGWFLLDWLKTQVGPKIAEKDIFPFLAGFAQISIGTVFVLQFVRTVLVMVGRVFEAQAGMRIARRRAAEALHGWTANPGHGAGGAAHSPHNRVAGELDAARGGHTTAPGAGGPGGTEP